MKTSNINYNEQQTIISYSNNGMLVNDIANKLNRNEKSIRNILNKNKIPIHFNDKRIKKWSEQNITTLKNMVQSNISHKQIAIKLNRGVAAISKKLKELNLNSNFLLKIEENKCLKSQGKKKCNECQQIKNIKEFKHWCRKCENCRNLILQNRIEKMSKNNDLKYILMEKLKWNRYRVKKYKFECDIDLQFLIELYNKQNGKCYYSNRVMSLSTHNENSISIDRIDSTQGYTKNNVVLCCNRVNLIKNDMTIENFKNIIIDLYNNINNF